jgi:hypothetical protein
LKNARLSGVGVELSAVTVQLLNRAGLKAVQGAAPGFPWENPEPFAIAFFEVLEHLPEPREIIEPLKKRFSRAVILGSVPCPTGATAGTKAPTDSPPHKPHWNGSSANSATPKSPCKCPNPSAMNKWPVAERSSQGSTAFARAHLPTPPQQLPR